MHIISTTICISFTLTFTLGKWHAYMRWWWKESKLKWTHVYYILKYIHNTFTLAVIIRTQSRQYNWKKHSGIQHPTMLEMSQFIWKLGHASSWWKVKRQYTLCFETEGNNRRWDLTYQHLESCSGAIMQEWLDRVWPNKYDRSQTQK